MITIASDGTKVFRQEALPYLVPMLEQYGVEAVEGDPTRVKLLPRTQPGQVTASQWVEGYGKMAIAAVEWLPTAHEPKFLRAIRPEEAQQIAQPTGYYAILTGPVVIVPPSVPWPSPSTPPVTPPPPMPKPSELEELPPDVRTKVEQLMAGSNANAMEAAANEIEKQGYARSAEALRKRAAEVRLASTVSNTTSGRTYTVRGTELPSQLAQWYTGDANRWRDLVQTNPELRIRKVGEIEYLLPWKSGMTITLPSTWDVKKGPMPIQSNAKPSAGTPSSTNSSQLPAQATQLVQTQSPPPK
jgi:hypothetical protein